MSITRGKPPAICFRTAPLHAAAAIDATSTLNMSSDLPRLDSHCALFLDFDGTLVELAARPEAVHVPAMLPSSLARMSERLGGALAVVSGRPIGDLDHFLAPLRLPLAAEHGAQRRTSGDAVIMSVASPDLSAVIHRITAFADQHSGLRVETKTAAVALHYRQAPDLEALCLQAMSEAAESTASVELLHGKFVFEIKPFGVSKGTAITDFMKQAPFKGRMPVFAGDDVTDEAGFAAVQAMGGVGIKIGPGSTLAAARMASPAVLLAWLETAASSDDRSEAQAAAYR
jgi:trehalose 6-phosphate phosphatase